MVTAAATALVEEALAESSAAVRGEASRSKTRMRLESSTVATATPSTVQPTATALMLQILKRFHLRVAASAGALARAAGASVSVWAEASAGSLALWAAASAVASALVRLVSSSFSTSFSVSCCFVDASARAVSLGGQQPRDRATQQNN